MQHSHTLLGQEYRLSTPTLLAVIQSACFNVLMRKTGVVFVGHPRVGKTSCCEALIDEIPKRFPNVYVFMIPAANVDVNMPSYSSIVHQMLALEEIVPKPRTPFIQRQDMLIERLMIRAAQVNARHIVMLIDELQRLSAADFSQLTDIYNKLRSRKVILSIISFAMPSIEKKITLFSASEDGHIIGRFLSDIRPLTGITSATQLSYVLGLYDEPLKNFDGEICYTSDILPKAFSVGFRMAALSGDIWREMSKVATGNYVNNLPMEHVTQTVAYIFVILNQEDREDLVVPSGLIAEAVHESNFRSFCLKTSKPYAK